MRPLSVAIAALGGQGGGVLADWIVETAEEAGWRVQCTSVPGVAQRTGTTVYYLEMCPAPEEGAPEPVFALMPVPGDVDVVLGAELVEAGRALARGLVTPERTTLIASTHRIYGITERTAPGDGIVDARPVLEALERHARRCISFDMEAAAQQSGSMISAVLLGALAVSGALPFARERYERIIRRSGGPVDANLAGFAAGFAGAGARRPAQEVSPTFTKPTTAAGQRLEARLLESFPSALCGLISEGVRRMLDYQDEAYGHTYLERLEAVQRFDVARGGGARAHALSATVARHLALAMTYEDPIRIAELKTRRARVERFREEVRAEPGQIVYVTEYLHPRFEELCDTLPRALGERLARSRLAVRLFALPFRRGRHVHTSKLLGFCGLFLLARCRRWRRGTRRFAREQQHIEAWLGRIVRAGSYDLGLEIAECRRLIKGYGDTHERGLRKYALVMAALDAPAGADVLVERARRLRTAALADEDGTALRQALEALGLASERGADEGRPLPPSARALAAGASRAC